MNWFRILFFVLLSLTSSCSDEKSDTAEKRLNTESLIIYKKSSSEVRKGYFVEVAHSREEMAKGLMGRNHLDKHGRQLPARTRSQSRSAVSTRLHAYRQECRTRSSIHQRETESPDGRERWLSNLYYPRLYLPQCLWRSRQSAAWRK